MRVSIVLPEKSLVRSLAVSPDGRFVAVVLVKDGKQQIWIRAFDALDMTGYVWRDREGKDLGTFGNAGGMVTISPDGKRLVGDPGATTIEIQDLGTGRSRP